MKRNTAASPHLYPRRAKALGALFGDAAAHRDRLAADLGLIPASPRFDRCRSI
jgi:hypothetical protein